MGPAIGLYAANPRVESPSSATTICERYTSHWRTWLMLGSEQSRPSTGSGSSFSASTASFALRTVTVGDQKVFIPESFSCSRVVTVLIRLRPFSVERLLEPQQIGTFERDRIAARLEDRTQRCRLRDDDEQFGATRLERFLLQLSQEQDSHRREATRGVRVNPEFVSHSHARGARLVGCKSNRFVVIRRDNHLGQLELGQTRL